MDVALFIASWKEVLKGLGVRGKGAPRFSWDLSRRIFIVVQMGSESEVENSIEKVIPKGPQMDRKSKAKLSERVFWKGSKEEPKNGTLCRTRKS